MVRVLNILYFSIFSSFFINPMESQAQTKNASEFKDTVHFSGTPKIWRGSRLDGVSNQLDGSIPSGQLSIDQDSRAAKGTFQTMTTPIAFTGTFEPFTLSDPSQGEIVIYTILGTWHGSGDANSKCLQKKDGHAYWGKFSLKVEGLDISPRSILRLETCPIKSGKYSELVYEYKIQWGKLERGHLFLMGEQKKKVEDFFYSFNPPAGVYYKGDPILIAKKAKENRNSDLAIEKKRIKSGLVYKPLKYWLNSMGSANYLEFEIASMLKNIFDGVYKEIKPKDLDNLKLIYISYVRSFDQQCRSYIQKPIIKSVVIEETNKYGEVARDRGQSFHVESKFSDTFNEYYDWRKKWYIREATRLAMSGKIISGAMGIATKHRSITDSVVSTVKCDSATMKQFSENLWRIAHNKQSLQITGTSIPGAEAESEIPAAIFSDTTTKPSTRSKPYHLINPMQRIITKEGREIAFYFNYYCQDCNKIERMLQQLIESQGENITFERFPLSGIQAYTYYTAVELNIGEKIHRKMLKRMPYDFGMVASPYNAYALFKEHGIDRQTSSKIFMSDSVKEKVERIKQLENKMRFKSVPTLIVNGSYVVTKETCQCTTEEMLELAINLALKKE